MFHGVALTVHLEALHLARLVLCPPTGTTLSKNIQRAVTGGLPLVTGMFGAMCSLSIETASAE